jgi:type IV pilus assembly protein PilC
MASFLYVARETASGREISSSVDAATEQAAIAALLNRNMLVLSIKEKVSKLGRTNGGRVALGDLVIFTRQLATMVDAGLPIVKSLNSLANQTRSKVMRDVIRDVCARVENGDSFSEALQKHPKAFSRLYVCMVGAGEKGGLLAEILARLAVYLENTARLRKKVKSAMMYPTVVCVAALVVTMLLLVKVVPVFGEIFTNFKATLPAPTQYLINISNIVKNYAVVFMLAAGGGVYGWLSFIKTPPGRYLWDARRIRLPVFGTIAHKICLSRFTRTFASLVRSGVPIVEVLHIVSETVGNMVMEKAVKVVAEDIQRGESVSAALAKHPVFPDMIVRMVSAGEETGRMDNMLERVADFLDEEIDTTLSGLTALIEPILIVFLGVVVGGIVICMFLPIFKLPEIVNNQ